MKKFHAQAEKTLENVRVNTLQSNGTSFHFQFVGVPKQQAQLRTGAESPLLPHHHPTPGPLSKHDTIMAQVPLSVVAVDPGQRTVVTCAYYMGTCLSDLVVLWYQSRILQEAWKVEATGPKEEYRSRSTASFILLFLLPSSSLSPLLPPPISHLLPSSSSSSPLRLVFPVLTLLGFSYGNLERERKLKRALIVKYLDSLRHKRGIKEEEEERKGRSKLKKAKKKKKREKRRRPQSSHRQAATSGVARSLGEDDVGDECFKCL